MQSAESRMIHGSPGLRIWPLVLAAMTLSHVAAWSQQTPPGIVVPPAPAPTTAEPALPLAATQPATDNGARIKVSEAGNIELHVRDLDLTAIIQMLSMHSKRNIVTTAGLEGRKVTANLYNVPFEQAMDAVLLSNGCVWHQKDGFYYVYPARAGDGKDNRPLDIQVSLDGRVSLRAYDQPLSTVLQTLSAHSGRNIVPYARAADDRVTTTITNVPFDDALTALLDQFGAGWEERNNLIYVYAAEAWARKTQEKKEATQLETRLFKLHYVTPEEAEKMIRPMLSTVEGEISALNRSDILAGNITAEQQLQSGEAQVDGVANSLLRTRQVQPVGVGSANSKEKELTETIKADAASFSVGSQDLDNAFLLVRDYKENLDRIATVIAQIDARPKQVLVEATIMRARLDENNAMGIDFNFLGGVDFEDLNSISPGVTDLATGDVPLNKLRGTDTTVRTDFNNAVPNGGFTFGIVKGSVAMFVRALEQITDTTILANPKMLVLDKQEGQVLVGREDGYRNTIVTQTAAIETVEQLQTGTKFKFRPFIGNDGYIRITVRPEDSSGGLTGSNLPFKQTTEVETSVLVRDGHTILIGGLFREVSMNSRGQVPVLGNIPLAGALFRNATDTSQREEVIILLTVHVVKDDEQADKLADEALQDVERYRVGMRQGLMFHGRERLAQAHYRWAMEHVSKGNTGLALWDLQLAINNNPKMLAAIKLKERITGEREFDEDSSAIRTFVQQLIAQEDGQTGPFFGRPEPLMEALPIETPDGLDKPAPGKPQAHKNPDLPTPSIDDAKTPVGEEKG